MSSGPRFVTAALVGRSRQPQDKMYQLRYDVLKLVGSKSNLLFDREVRVVPLGVVSGVAQADLVVFSRSTKRPPALLVALKERKKRILVETPHGDYYEVDANGYYLDPLAAFRL